MFFAFLLNVNTDRSLEHEKFQRHVHIYTWQLNIISGKTNDSRSIIEKTGFLDGEK